MNNKNHIKAIIVDDERLARRGVQLLLQDYPHINIVGEAATIAQTIQLIKTQKPELVFLDIQLGGESGFDLFQRIELNCKVVFVTAYDEYALRAFEINALDYLLKPINRTRLAKTIQRVTDSPPIQVKPVQLRYDDRIIRNDHRRTKFIKVRDIKFINAESDYSLVRMLDNQSEMFCRTLKKWEEILPAENFIRIHRSTIINFEYIEKIEKSSSQRNLVYLTNTASPVVMSQRYTSSVKKQFKFPR